MQDSGASDFGQLQPVDNVIEEWLTLKHLKELVDVVSKKTLPVSKVVLDSFIQHPTD